MPPRVSAVRWRAVLGVLGAALLPVPLVLVLVSSNLGPRQPREQVNLSPMLSSEERLQRATYQRRCQTSAECEPPLGCLKHWRLIEPVCMDSECVTDAQCEAGDSCQVLRTEGGRPHVRVCVTQGVRREGERCVALPRDREDACAPGLRCFEGWCGRPCRMDTPGNCPEGFFCEDDVSGPVCLPTCEAQGCPEGQQCVRAEGRKGARPVSECAVVYGSNCRESPCPEGQKCLVQHSTRRPGERWMACVQRCGDGQPACPEGLLCSEPYCRSPCESQDAGTCGWGLRCGQLTSGGAWVCMPGF
jgi:hypothetical protein